MEFTLLTTGDRHVVRFYGNGGFRIGEQTITGSILLFPDRIVTWPVARFEDLRIEHFDEVLKAEPKIEILVIGCGATMELVPATIRGRLRAERLALESMNTGAACRTYNLLLAEDRRVAAALIAVD